ncbi:MAG: TatD family hydrolase [Oscillospiraceae bacterium]|nr:TatD family hydrolase [Oscillospiraceae bacterium]
MNAPLSPLFDTHAHYDDAAFDADRHAVLEALTERYVRVVNAGCDLVSSRASVALAERYPFVYAACGVHPSASAAAAAGSLVWLEELLLHPKCVALGEIGLDYHYPAPARETQRAVFAAQLEMAARSGKPVIVHNREAHGDAMEMVRQYHRRAVRGTYPLRGVFHCFSGSAEMARELTDMGWYIGLAGPLTYKNARRLRETAAAVPRVRVLLETDAPYLPPQSRRGKRCDSSMLPETAAALADIWGISAEAALLQTYCNGVDFYGL